MSDDPFVSPGEGQVRRTRDGRPYVWSPEKKKEVPYTRVTNFIDVLEDKFILHQWMTRNVLKGLRDSDGAFDAEFFATMLLPEDEQDKALNDLMTRAAEAAGANERRDIGTELHELTEMMDRNEGISTEDAGLHLADLHAYDAALQRHRLVPVEFEVFVVNDELKTGGTFDRIFEWYRDGWDEPPLRVIGDLKTGRVDYAQGKLAMQLALYAMSHRYDPEEPESRGGLRVSTLSGLIVHLPQGEATCKVYETDLVLGWEGVKLANEVRDWRRRTARGVLSDLDLEVDKLS